MDTCIMALNNDIYVLSLCGQLSAVFVKKS